MGDDPVHLTPKGYSLAAAGLKSLMYEKRAEEKEDEPGGWQGAAKQPKQDLTQNRPDWVKESIAEAVRKDTSLRGRPLFSHHKWRGGQRGGQRGGIRGRASGGYSAYRGAGPARGREYGASGRGHGSGRGWKVDRSCGLGRLL